MMADGLPQPSLVTRVTATHSQLTCNANACFVFGSVVSYCFCHRMSGCTAMCAMATAARSGKQVEHRVRTRVPVQGTYALLLNDALPTAQLLCACSKHSAGASLHVPQELILDDDHRYQYSESRQIITEAGITLLLIAECDPSCGNVTIIQ